MSSRQCQGGGNEQRSPSHRNAVQHRPHGLLHPIRAARNTLQCYSQATRPSIWMPSIMLAWGIVMTLTGIVKDFKGLVICRVFLGITEVDAPVPNATCSQLADNQVYTSLASFQAQHTF